jgi:hypothetical protein
MSEVLEEFLFFVFWFNCAVFSLDPRTLELEYVITDLRGENLFAPLPLAALFLPWT